MDAQQDKEKLFNTSTSGQTSAQMTATHQVLQMNVQNKWYAIDLNYVECVLPLMELNYVPGDVPYLVGLMDYHGSSLAVIDLGIWLGFNTTESYTLDTPVVICGNGRAEVAFVVNEAVNVEMVKPENIHMQDSFKESNSPFKASLNLNSGMVLLLDMPRILSVNFTSLGSNAKTMQRVILPETTADKSATYAAGFQKNN